MINRFLFASLITGVTFGEVLAGDFDIVVKDQAVVQRCVTKDSSRSIAVGLPGGFSFVFDPVRCRLAYVWYGDFLDYRPEATGRGGGRVGLLGNQREVGTGDIPLRIHDPHVEPESIRFLGYRKESATLIPTFLFNVDGVDVEQKVVSFGYDQVTIELSFLGNTNGQRYYQLDQNAVEAVELSEGLDWVEPGIIQISASQNWAQIRIKLKPTNEKFVRQEPTTSGPMLYALHCMSCHTLDGTKRIGPSFADLWTSKRIVTRDGKTEDIEASEPYIRESLLNPQAAIVRGYEQANKMIKIQDTLNEKQIDALVKYLVDLKTKPKKP